MADRDYRVIVSERARQMLGAHIRFVAKVSRDAAISQKKELITAIRSLSRMPQRYPFLEGDFIPPNQYHKMFVKKQYLVLYQIRDDVVYVDYVLDCRKDYTWLVH